MPAPTLALGALLALPIVAVYACAGVALARRGAREHRAWWLFAAFWLGVGAYGLAEALWTGAHFAGWDSLALGRAILHVKIFASLGAFGGLVAYLSYVLTGRRAAVAAALAAYALLLFATEAFYAWRDPVATRPGDWGMRLDYARPALEPWWTLLLALLLAPPVLAAGAYAWLTRYAEDATQRRRARFTSFSLLAFFAPTLVAWSLGGAPWWGLAEKSLGLAAAVGLLLAWWPSGPGPLARDAGASPAQREAAFDARVRDLV